MKVFSSGRINIIGEHVDYVYGLSIPASINIGNFIKIEKLDNKKGLLINSKSYNRNLFLSYDEIYSTKKDDLKNLWYGYIIAPFLLLYDKGIIINEPLNLEIDTTLPMAAGLSSSASILCGIFYAITKYFNFPFDKFQIAKFAKETENKYIGAPCGFLDQLAICFGKKDRLTVLDYKALEERDKNKRYKNLLFGNKFLFRLKLKKDFDIYIINSNVKHSIAGEGYKTRIEEKNQLESILKDYGFDIRAFVEFYLKRLGGLKKIEKINQILFKYYDLDKKYSFANKNEYEKIIKESFDLIFTNGLKDSKFKKIIKEFESKNINLLKRTFHFISEIGRTKFFIKYLKNNNFEKAFELLWFSHVSLFLFYEVSVDEIEFIINHLNRERIINNSNIIKGARIMGGGFGGSVILIAEKNSEDVVENVLNNLNKSYYLKFMKNIDFYKVKIDDGLKLI